MIRSQFDEKRTFQNLNKVISGGTLSIVKRPPSAGSRKASNARQRSKDGPPILRKPRILLARLQFKLPKIC